MRRIVLGALSTLSATVLLFSYSTSTSGPTTSASTSFESGATAGTAVGSTPSATEPSSSSSSSTTPSASSTSTLTGEVAQTRWGPVQVELTMDGAAISAVSVLQYPQGNGRDVEINDRALPILINETMSAQSADIDVVSGATVTSDGYLQSLQSALDQA